MHPTNWRATFILKTLEPAVADFDDPGTKELYVKPPDAFRGTVHCEKSVEVEPIIRITESWDYPLDPLQILNGDPLRRVQGIDRNDMDKRHSQSATEIQDRRPIPSLLEALHAKSANAAGECGGTQKQISNLVHTEIIRTARPPACEMTAPLMPDRMGPRQTCRDPQKHNRFTQSVVDGNNIDGRAGLDRLKYGVLKPQDIVVDPITCNGDYIAGDSCRMLLDSEDDVTTAAVCHGAHVTQKVTPTGVGCVRDLALEIEMLAFLNIAPTRVSRYRPR